MLRKRTKNIIPGFGLSFGITITMLSLVVLIPLLSIILSISDATFSDFWRVATETQTISAYKVSLFCSFIAAAINVVFGILLAWILTRYNFPGRRLLDGLIELPFALPTAVAGIALTTLYSEKGWFGQLFASIGIKISYTKTGIIIAMVFVGIPFVVRSIQPVLEKLDGQYEEAGTVLGASRSTIFFKIIFPEILPAALTGFGLAFARCIGEYGSVIFIAGNIPYKTQVLPVIVMGKLEQFKYAEATFIALIMVVFSFLLLFLINIIQSKINKLSKG